ncbi:TolC family protein [Flavobacterium ovatum]|uniref:TolC family protein n=1 Tax=Flavobacterium ovatum TaxID=1928857 RepID=UPI00344C1DF4
MIKTRLIIVVMPVVVLLFSFECVIAQNDLSYYNTAAKQNSPLINDNKLVNKSNQLEIERLKAFYTKAQIGVTANYLFSPLISKDNNKTTFEANSAGATNYYGYDLAYSNGGTYQAMLNVSQPLFNGIRYKTASEQVAVASQISQNNVLLTEHDLEKIVSDQYILCLQDNKQTGYAETMVKLLADQKDILIKLVESSIYKQSDLSLLSIEHQNFVAQLTTFKANYRRDLMDLNILCGINDTQLHELQNMELSLKNTSAKSMFMEKYRLDSINLVAQQKIVELKYKPQINLYANTGLNATYAPTIPDRFGLSAGVNFTYNFFDGGQKQLTQKKTKVLEESISFYKDNFISQNTIRKSKIEAEIESFSTRIAIADQQLKDYDSLLKTYKKEIFSGQLTIINYITVLKNMAMLQRDNAILISQQQLLINVYNYWNW